MPADALQKASLAYRRGQADIWDGRIPDKYRRIVPYCTGARTALELGSAEGVLSLLLVRERAVESIIGLELRPERHAEALRLQARWTDMGDDVSRCSLRLGNILEQLDVLAGVDLLVCVRSVYYLRDHAPTVIRYAFEQNVRRIVLCGNRGRQAQFRRDPDSDLGRFNRLSSIEGMTDLLFRAGYAVDAIIDEGDPIVVGRHPHFA